MRRHKHSLSHYKLFTGRMGELIPIACFEALPGDTIQQATSALVRVSPLVAPVMHPVSVRIHHWFVPVRLVFPLFERFITGGFQGDGDSVVMPMADLTGVKGELTDYMGIRPGATVRASILPFRAYNLIYNEFYRDQNVVSAVTPDWVGAPNRVAWEKDYFTTSTPWPQKGPDVSLPLGVNAPVVANTPGIPNFIQNDLVGGNLAVKVGGTGGAQDVKFTGATAPAFDSALYWGSDTGLVADLTNATAVNVNQVRLAFALQRFQEARARYGSRYTEYLRYLGVKSSDARLQRPEYLGGGKQIISFSEVLQTGPTTDDDGVATMFGHGISAMRTRRYRRFFEEHGYVLSLMSVRPRTMYVDGLPRMFSREFKEDFWQRELEQIGQQEVFKREIYAVDAASGGDDVFGYQDRYAEYKHLQSSVAGDFRDTLNHWHMGRSFSAAPTLNQSFVECDPTTRIYQDTASPPLWVMCSHSIQARRMVSKSGASRIM